MNAGWIDVHDPCGQAMTYTLVRFQSIKVTGKAERRIVKGIGADPEVHLWGLMQNECNAENQPVGGGKDPWCWGEPVGERRKSL